MGWGGCGGGVWGRSTDRPTNRVVGRLSRPFLPSTDGPTDGPTDFAPPTHPAPTITHVHSGPGLPDGRRPARHAADRGVAGGCVPRPGATGGQAALPVRLNVELGLCVGWGEGGVDWVGMGWAAVTGLMCSSGLPFLMYTTTTARPAPATGGTGRRAGRRTGARRQWRARSAPPGPKRTRRRCRRMPWTQCTG